MQRREFLAAAAAAMWATSVSADETPLEMIDCHTHFYDPARPQGVPWPPKGDKSLYRTVLPDDYKRFAQPLGVVGTVVVEASPWFDDNQWLLDLAAKEPFILGVVGSLSPLDAEFESQVVALAKNPLYRGFRVNHNVLVEGLKANLVERVQLLVDHDLELDVNGGPDMAADVARLAEQAPELRIVVNHCGNLKIDGREPPAKWLEGMTAAAKHPNVFCKVSALGEQTSQSPAPREVNYYRPVLDALWERFGEDRLIFGSNWPVSDRGAPFETVIGVVREYFTGKGERAAAKYFTENSKTAYRWRART